MKLLVRILFLFAYLLTTAASQTVFVTVTASPSSAPSSAATATSSPSPTSTPCNSEDGNCGGGNVAGTPSSQTGNEGGASGASQGSFGISKGGIAAIIAVVVVVAVIGIASVSLYFIAKKRQWEVRKSIRRASRRVTGRFQEARSRRASAVAGGAKGSSPSRDRLRDVEKGGATSNTTEMQRKVNRKKSFVGKIFGAA